MSEQASERDYQPAYLCGRIESAVHWLKTIREDLQRTYAENRKLQAQVERLTRERDEAKKQLNAAPRPSERIGGNEAMRIIFCPNDDQKIKTGTMSRISWENTQLQDAIRKVFNESPREILTALEIDKYGLTAVFEPSNRG